MADMIGRMLGAYQITDEVGHGGMANVYLAAQPSVGRDVAIKVLPSQFLQDRNFLERFTREVKLIAQLQHPRILPIYDFGEQDGMPYIVMAYMTGGSLADLIRQSSKGMALDEVARLIGQAAEGLDYAHEKGIIHRDFKPSNVLLDAKGNAHLADFGIAKATADSAQITGSGFIGTPAYAAPEMSSPGGLSPRIDVYALGVTLYQMLTGRLPYDAETPMGVLMAHMGNPIPDAREVRRGLSDGIQQVIERAMAKNPDERYQSAGDLAADLRRAMASSPVERRKGASTKPMKADQPAPVTLPEEDPITQASTMPEQDAAWSTTPITAARPQIAPPDVTTARPRGKRWVLFAEIGLCVVLVVAGVLFVPRIVQMITAGGSGDGGDQESGETSGGADSGGITLNAMTADKVFVDEQVNQAAYNFAFSPDESRLIAGLEDTITIWDANSLEFLLHPPSDGADGQIRTVEISPDGSLFIAAIGFCFNLYEVDSGEYVGDMCPEGGLVDGAEFSPDGKFLAGGGGGSELAVWQIDTREVIWKVEQAHIGNIHDVTYSPDGGRIASAAEDAVVNIWDAAGGDLIQAFEADADDLWDVDFSPDGLQIAAAASNGQVWLWDVESGEQVATGEGDGSAIFSLAYSPDGSMLAGGTEQGNIVIRSTTTGDLLTQFKAHEGAVTMLRWLKDGGSLVSSGMDGKIIVWKP